MAYQRKTLYEYTIERHTGKHWEKQSAYPTQEDAKDALADV